VRWENKMSKDLFDLVAGIVNVSPQELTLESGPENLPKWDSLAQITIVSAIEQKYSIKLTMPEILSIRSVANLQELIEKHGGITN